MNRGNGEEGRGRLKHQKRSGVRAGEIAGLTDAAHAWGEKEGSDIMTNRIEGEKSK